MDLVKRPPLCPCCTGPAYKKGYKAGTQDLDAIFARLKEHAAQGRLDSDVWYAICKVKHG